MCNLRKQKIIIIGFVNIGCCVGKQINMSYRVWCKQRTQIVGLQPVMPLQSSKAAAVAAATAAAGATGGASSNTAAAI